VAESLTKEEKLRILKALEEDAEFRYAVAGAIGVLEILRRLDSVLKVIEEHSKRIEELSGVIEGHSRRLEELSKRFEELAKMVELHSRKLEELGKRFEEHSRRLEELTLALRDHGMRIDELNRRVSNLEVAVGALAESTYARYFYEDLLRELASRGEVIVRRVRNARVGEEDVDLLVETQLRVYVVEVKIRPKHEDVGRVLAKVDVVRRYYPDKGVVGVLAGAMVGREVESYAREKGVEVYAY